MDLNSYIADFYMSGMVSQDDIKQHNQLILDFNETFTYKKLCDLSYDEYVLGKNNKNSYSYWLEFKTHMIGSIKGGTISKHQIWFDKNQHEVKATRKFKDGDSTPIEKMRSLLSYLKKNGEHLNYDEIDALPGSNTLKYKTLYLFYPEKYMPMFSDNMYSYFLKQIGHNPKLYKGLGIKQKLMLEWKNSDEKLSKMSAFEFAYFLHYLFGKPKSVEGKLIIEGGKLPENSIAERGTPYKVVENPKIQNHQRKKKIQNSKTPVKINYAEMNEKRSFNGFKGENIVMRYENDRMKESKYRKDIEQVSINDDSKGYDIQSYEKDGETRYIEVKTTSSKGIIDFYISQNEMDFGLAHQNYWIYVVTNIHGEQPVIYTFKNPFNNENSIDLKPVTYSATIKL